MYLYVFHKHSVGGTISPQTKIKFLPDIVRNEIHVSMFKNYRHGKIVAGQRGSSESKKVFFKKLIVNKLGDYTFVDFSYHID